MSRVNPCSEFDNLSDIQLLEVMLTNDNAHSCIYLRHKTYCINFMISKGASEIDALDIYQDATIVLYEKNRDPEFRLTSSIQTYLNSICYNQLLARSKSSYTKKIVLKEEVDENVLENLNIENGVRVKDLGEGKLARYTDIREGFIITHINETPVKTVKDVNENLSRKKSGELVILSGRYENSLREYNYAFRK